MLLDKLIFLLTLAGTAMVFADVLVRDGMLLAPVQRWLREWYIKATSIELDAHNVCYRELDNQWWWAPLWGCFKCVAGQWGFWGYLVRYHAGYSWRTVPEHLTFTAFTIIAAIILHKWTKD